jgi:hypothetical protein
MQGWKHFFPTSWRISDKVFKKIELIIEQSLRASIHPAQDRGVKCLRGVLITNVLPLLIFLFFMTAFQKSEKSGKEPDATLIPCVETRVPSLR